MSKTIIFDPPKTVAGHPIEILEISIIERSPIWALKLRITPPGEKPVECGVRYDAGKRITIDFPDEPDASGILMASRGAGNLHTDPNPLAEAVEAAIPNP